jgi:hypothetical protein
MFAASRVSVNVSTPALLYSGTGRVRLKTTGAQYILLGGPAVSAADGFSHQFGSVFEAHLEEPSEIYGLSDGSGTYDVQVLADSL